MMVLFALAAGCLGSDQSNDPVATDSVRIPGAWVFEPRVIEIDNGTTVTWTNDGGQAHTVTFEELGYDEVIEPGDTLERTFTEPGTYEYICRYHPPDMDGRVIVRAGSVDETG